jgi:hypoxanthine phosphoribosyltransferase
MQEQHVEMKVSWDEYHRAIELLALKVHSSHWKFDQILCLARGGLRIGDVFSRVFKVPLAILSVSSYRDKNGTKQSELNISSTMTATVPYLSGNVLVIDDLVDSGGSIREVMRILPQMFQEIVSLKSAVIWYKQNSSVEPDFYLEHVLGNPWIVQPFEVYDRLQIADLDVVDQSRESKFKEPKLYNTVLVSLDSQTS